MRSLVERWNAAYFDNRLSQDVVAALEPLNEASAEAQAVVDRAFRLMRVARLDATDLPAFTARILTSASKVVPSAWDGAVPPITMTGRHHKLDDYVAANPWHRPTGEPVLVDLGCGFPPFTAVDSAANLAGWRIIGADPSFARYLLYDDRGDYACFDDDTHLRYCQFARLDSDSAATRARFRHLLRRLLPLLPGNDTGELVDVEHKGARLVHNPLRRYERANLVLVKGEVGALPVDGGVNVIRCMNVLMYFDLSFRERALEWASGMLRPGGLLIGGSNWTHSIGSRYTVYQEHNGYLMPREFALSIDNVRPITSAPWYALHDGDVENLCNAEAVRIIRSDEDFRHRFDERLDALLAQTGICRRGTDGYLGDAAEDTTLADLDKRNAAVVEQLDREGYVDEAVTVLRRTGREAWRNAVGHIAMRPVPPHPLAAPVVGPFLPGSHRRQQREGSHPSG
jgi:hypothetical protein